jgi:hypothetical protein
MPQAIGAAIVAAVGITGTAATIAAAVVSAAITAGVSYGISAFLAPKPRANRSGAGRSPKPAPSDRQFVSKNPVARRSRSYGRVVLSGAQQFSYVKSGTFYRVLAHHTGKIDAVEKHWIDGHEVSRDANGWVTTSRYVVDGSSRARVLFRLGNATQTAYSQLTAAYPGWNADHRGDGIVSSLTMFKQVKQEKFFEVWPNAENATYKMQIRASIVFDPRTNTSAWSENAALCIRDYLLHETGFGIPSSWITAENAAWQAEASACDDVVASGTKRYVISYTYDFGSRPSDVLKDMLEACNGRIMLGQNGGLRLVTGRWVEPEYTIDASMIEDYTLECGPEGTQDATVIKAIYVSPAHGYVEQEAQPYVNTAAVAQRGEIVRELDLMAVPSHNQARRLMKQEAMKSSPEWSGTIVTNLGALPVLTERFVVIELPIGETFYAELDRIDFRMSPDQPGVITGLVISYTSVIPDRYAAEAGDDGDGVSVPEDIDGDEALPAVSGLTLTIDTDRIATVSWTAHDPDTLRTDVQYRRSTVSTWTIAGTAADGETEIEFGPLVTGASYYVRVRTRGVTERVGDWASAGPVTA